MSVSIIIPIYNVEKYLRQCLDSVVNQTYKNIEIILVDDGSTDGSYSIAKEYADKDNRINLLQKSNGGLSDARNFGLKYVTKPYVLFLDSDDYIAENTVELTLDAILQNDVDFVLFGASKFSDDKEEFDNSYFNPIFPDKLIVSPENINSIPVVAWNKLYKVENIKKYNLEFPKGLWYEDEYWLWAYCCLNNNGFYIKQELYFYRIRSDSIMAKTNSKNSIKSLDMVSIYKNIYDFLVKMKIYTIWNDAFLYKTNSVLIWQKQFVNNSKYIDYYLKILDLLKVFSLDEIYNYKFLYNIKRNSFYIKFSKISFGLLNIKITSNMITFKICKLIKIKKNI